jgi:hypothetical protein
LINCFILFFRFIIFLYGEYITLSRIIIRRRRRRKIKRINIDVGY